MSKIVLVFVLLSLFSKNIHGDEDQLRFGWNIGNVKPYFDVINYDGGADVELLQFKWILNQYSIGFNALEFYYTDPDADYGIDHSLLPVEIAYVPFSYCNTLFLSLYGKLGWRRQYSEVRDHAKHSAYGAAGAQLFLFPETRINYSPYFSLFIEYDTLNRLKLGVGLDLSVLITVFLWIVKGSVEEEHKQNSPARPDRPPWH